MRRGLTEHLAAAPAVVLVSALAAGLAVRARWHHGFDAVNVTLLGAVAATTLAIVLVGLVRGER